jgi:hypothetical protein
MGVNDNSLRKRLLREKDLTLETAINICRAAEQAQMQIKQMDGESAVHNLRRKQPQYRKQNTGNSFKPKKTVKDCQYCGDSHNKGQCKAFGKTCGICRGQNHFTKMCFSAKQKKSQNTHGKACGKRRPVHNVQEESQELCSSSENESEEDYNETDSDEVYNIKEMNTAKTHYMVKPQIKQPKEKQWKEITMQIDNGSSAN